LILPVVRGERMLKELQEKKALLKKDADASEA